MSVRNICVTLAMGWRVLLLIVCVMITMLLLAEHLRRGGGDVLRGARVHHALVRFVSLKRLPPPVCLYRTGVA